MNLIFQQVRANPKKVIFCEGEEEEVIRTAILWRDNGYGTPILIGKEKHIRNTMKNVLGERGDDGIEIQNAAICAKLDEYISYIYSRLQRKGYLYRDCARLVKTDRNVFGACMLACGDGDAIVTGLTRSYNDSLSDILRAIDPKQQESLCGISLMIANGKTIFIADTTIHELPTAEELAEIAIQTSNVARSLGFTPRVAMLSFSNFGNPMRIKAERVKEAVRILDSRQVDFEYDGEMSVDVALNENLMNLYPFCKLSGPANVLVMPSLHAASVSAKLLQELGGGLVIGPILVGLSKPVQIIQMGANVADILNISAFAALQAIKQQK